MNKQIKDVNNMYVYIVKLKKLQIYGCFLVTLEIMGLATCVVYVFASTFGFFNNTEYFVNITNSMMGLVVFMISIIMALLNSGNVRKKKNIIKKYLDVVKNDSSSDIKNKYKNKAEQILTPLDIYKGKIRRGERIGLHDKRDVIRNYIFWVGVVSIVIIATIILFVANLTFPVLIACGSLVVYSLVMLEFFIFQLIVNKNNSNVFSDKHKNIISTGKMQRIEDMEYLRKVLYSRCDRFKNYLLTLRISTIVMNVLSISMTIIITGDSEKIRTWFGFENASNIISVVFAVLSVIVYFVDLLFGSLIDEKINDMEEYISLPYSRQNYEDLKLTFPNLLKYKGIFDRNALDVARGTYEYNIEIINGKENRTIHYKHLFTVKHRIINNIPRVKLTTLVIFLFLWSILVWYKMNIYNIIYVCIITLIAFLVSYRGMLAFDLTKYQKWSQFCEMLNDNDLHK